MFFVVTATTLPWLLVLLWPGRAPMWALVLLVIGLAAGGPGSSIGFDFARTFNPAHRLGTATGIVIMGAFTAALANILVIGIVLDLVSGGDPYTLTDFRIAMSTQVVFFVAGIAGIVSTRRIIRERTREQGVVIAPLGVALKRRAARAVRRRRHP